MIKKTDRKSLFRFNFAHPFHIFTCQCVSHFFVALIHKDIRLRRRCISYLHFYSHESMSISILHLSIAVRVHFSHFWRWHRRMINNNNEKRIDYGNLFFYSIKHGASFTANGKSWMAQQRKKRIHISFVFIT